MAVFDFPNPVDEVSARMVAGGVVVLAAAYVATGWVPLLVVLAYGFVARVLSGPTLSPWGTLVTRVLRPVLPVEARLTPGPPKRFAQGIGAALTVTALVTVIATGGTGPARVLVAMVVAAASLEAVVGFCLGCWMFARLMRAGVVPESVCLECADITARAPAS